MKSRKYQSKAGRVKETRLIIMNLYPSLTPTCLELSSCQGDRWCCCYCNKWGISYYFFFFTPITIYTILYCTKNTFIYSIHKTTACSAISSRKKLFAKWYLSFSFIWFIFICPTLVAVILLWLNMEPRLS